MTSSGKLGLGFAAAVVGALVWGLAGSPQVRLARRVPEAKSSVPTALPRPPIRPSVAAPASAEAAAEPFVHVPSPATKASDVTQLAEADLMHELEQVAPHDPELALSWVEEGNRRFGPSERRAAVEVRALVSLRRIGAARAAAERFLRDYPDSAEASQLARLTGVHARR